MQPAMRLARSAASTRQRHAVRFRAWQCGLKLAAVAIRFQSESAKRQACADGFTLMVTESRSRKTILRKAASVSQTSGATKLAFIGGPILLQLWGGERIVRLPRE